MCYTKLRVSFVPLCKPIPVAYACDKLARSTDIGLSVHCSTFGFSLNQVFMQNSGAKNAVELVVYLVKKDKVNQFPTILDSVRTEITKISWFISYSTYISDKEQWKFRDIVSWNSIERAVEGAKLFSALSEMKPFSEWFEQVTPFKL